MLINVKTWNGHNINDGSSYQAVLQNQHTVPDATPVFIGESNADPRDSGVYTVDVNNKVLSIQVKNYANRYDLIAGLKTWFKRGTQGALVVTFGDDGVDYQVTARVISLINENNSNQNWTAVLQAGSSTWRAVTETTEPTWTVTGTSETLAIDVGGCDETCLSVDLTPTAVPASGYLYQQIYRLPNTPGLAHGNIPWCITVDTATLITAGKMQADCDDLRIINMSTGQQLKRWISNPDDASTKIWINLDIAKGYSLALASNVSGAGNVTELAFVSNANTKASIAEMPKTGIVYHGNEWFAYNGTDAVNCKLAITTRGLFGTTIEAHTAGVAFLYIQYPLMMVYGNSGATDPAGTDTTYDDTKPFIDLENSSNSSWVWGGSYNFFRKILSSRTAWWKVTKSSQGIVSDYYDFLLTSPTTPGIAFQVESYQRQGQWQPENAIFQGIAYRSAGITSVTLTGKKYRNTATWPTASVDASIDGITYTNLFTEASPSALFADEDWSHNSTPASTLTGTNRVRVLFAGGFPFGVKAAARLEIVSCTAAFNSSNIPTGTLLSEHQGMPMDITIRNQTTGDQISIDYNMLLNKVFSVDGENNLVQYDGYNAFGSLQLDDEGRSIYLRLQGAGLNTIEISGSDLGTIEVDLHWFERRL